MSSGVVGVSTDLLKHEESMENVVLGAEYSSREKPLQSSSSGEQQQQTTTTTTTTSSISSSMEGQKEKNEQQQQQQEEEQKQNQQILEKKKNNFTNLLKEQQQQQNKKSPSKKRFVRPGGKKRGTKRGSKVRTLRSQEDWYKACQTYRNLTTGKNIKNDDNDKNNYRGESGSSSNNNDTTQDKEKNPKKQQQVMRQIDFLKSELSGDLFTGNRSEQQSFGRKLKEYDAGILKPTNKKRRRERKFELLEQMLNDYLDLRPCVYKEDKCGISWSSLQEKCVRWGTELGGFNDFKGSPGWLAQALKNSGKSGILKGSSSSGSGGGDDNKNNNDIIIADDDSNERREEIMSKWRLELQILIQEKQISPSCVYSANQTGLFYSKLPNRYYADAANKYDSTGIKQIRDDNRITIMICTAADGTKVPLALVGKCKNPTCFSLTPDGTPPMAYINQTNAWFDRKVTLWWILEVFWPFHQQRQHHTVVTTGVDGGGGGADSSNNNKAPPPPAVLILDNASAYDIQNDSTIINKLPANLHVKFLPPKLTTMHHPIEMGISVKLKIGYKITVLYKLLCIFGMEGGYKRAYEARKKQRVGCQGLDYGGKAHILDVMHILQGLWEHQHQQQQQPGGEDGGMYARGMNIKHCWHKAQILPEAWEVQIRNDLWNSNVPIEDETFSLHDCTELCKLIHLLTLKVHEKNVGGVGVGDVGVVDTSTEVLALHGSFVNDGPFTPKDMEAMAKNWIDIEDDPFVVDAEIENAVMQMVLRDREEEKKKKNKRLKQDNENGNDEEAGKDDGVDNDNNNKEDCNDVDNNNDNNNNEVPLPIPTFLQVEDSIDSMRRYCEARNLPSEVRRLLDSFAFYIRSHESSSSSNHRQTT